LGGYIYQCKLRHKNQLPHRVFQVFCQSQCVLNTHVSANDKVLFGRVDVKRNVFAQLTSIYFREIKLKITISQSRDNQKMCNICKDVLQDFSIEHTEALCPLRNSRYCSYCAQYGHLTKSCPAKPSRMFREPAYLEQLIPYSDLKEFNITTKTPIKYLKPEEPQQLLEIKDDDRVISAYLAARAIKIQKGFTKREMLEEYAKQNNKRVVYIQ
jgi:hypothetical protein